MGSLRYQEGGSLGSFAVSGESFRYEYDADKNRLAITRKDCACDRFHIQLPEKIKANPRLFVHQLEKATQIKALILSNNQTIRLCETIVPDKLITIAKSVSRLALNSYDIGNNRISRFTDILRRGFGLKILEISYIDHNSSGQPYYKAKIVSQKDNCIVVREDTISDTLKKLSEYIASDLIIRELTAHSDHSSQKLLKLSTRLSVIAKILNDSFVPAKFMINQPDSLGHATSIK
ncbi:MAG: hypothetical protein ACLFR0_00305 [Alphaproteobacteria bacterium]